MKGLTPREFDLLSEAANPAESDEDSAPPLTDEEHEVYERLEERGLIVWRWCDVHPDHEHPIVTDAGRLALTIHRTLREVA